MKVISETQHYYLYFLYVMQYLWDDFDSIGSWSSLEEYYGDNSWSDIGDRSLEVIDGLL